jgi:hypothetical protein
MDRTQAAEIKRHLLDASAAIDRASMIAFHLDKDDRTTLGGSLGEISFAFFKLLQALYARYPELKPPPEPPAVSSTLEWHEVSLPASISEADIDQIIFSVMTSRLRKTALIIGMALQRCRELGLPISDEVLGARLHALAETDRIDSAGDVHKWRHSEVRLKS